MQALRLWRRHRHRCGCSPTTHTKHRDSLRGLTCRTFERADIVRVLQLVRRHVTQEGPPIPWPAMSCSLKIRSNQSVKHCRVKMPPWMTPRLTGKGSEHSVSPLGKIRCTATYCTYLLQLQIQSLLAKQFHRKSPSHTRWNVVICNITVSGR